MLSEDRKRVQLVGVDSAKSHKPSETQLQTTLTPTKGFGGNFKA
jgi:hypothetical protein